MTNEPEEKEENRLKDKLSGAAQFILGEIETIGGVLTADPIAQAEGELNQEIGAVRGEMADELEKEEKGE